MSAQDSTPIPDGYKRCSQCGTEYPVTPSFFYRETDTRFCPLCRNCRSIRYKGKPLRDWPPVGPGLRRCSKCRAILPLSEEFFYVIDNGRFQAKCKSCNIASVRRWQQEHPEIVNQNMRAYRKRHPDKVHQSNRRWYSSHVELARAYARRERLDPVKYARYRERIDRWKREHVDRFRSLQRKAKQTYRARHKNSRADFTVKDWDYCLNYWGESCAYCGRHRGLWHTLAQDHYIPLSKGGDYTKTNIVPACHGIGGCNNSKAGLEPSQWLTEKFGPRKAKQIIARIQAYFEMLEKNDAVD